MLAIILCTLNGEDFILDQLRSIKNQNYRNFDLYIKDNFSNDNTLKIIEQFKDENPELNIFFLDGDGIHFANSYLYGLKEIPEDYLYYAFCDQDDIWEKNHLERAIKHIKKIDQDLPVVHSSRTKLINEEGEFISNSLKFNKAPSFRNALVQSIAGANTMVFNKKAYDILMCVNLKLHVVSHDWLLYILVTAADGNFFYSLNPSINYRQHKNNLIGSNIGLVNSFNRVKLMLMGRFRSYNISNIRHLENFLEISDVNIKTYESYRASVFNKKYKRMYFLIKSRVYRQSFLGNIALYINIFFDSKNNRV